MRGLTAALSQLILLSGAALAEPSVLKSASGGVEQLRGTWQAARTGQTIEQGLRVGAGRALLQSGAGQVLLASGSALRIYQNEPDLQSGKFYLSGPLNFFAQGSHLAGSGQLRVDAAGPTRRVAVISGSVRIAVGTTLVNLSAGQQYDFAARKVSAFSERDPWYTSRFSGEGEVTVQATSGPVTVQAPAPLNTHNAALGERLESGQQVLTGLSAWAELGFSGGGYLRLQPESALSVLSVDKVISASGDNKREVTLKLTRGSAWNVVAKDQGGYEIATPTVTTAVRGTVFRVDASGLVKVFEGEVELPSSAGFPLGSGEQRAESGAVEPLNLDATDRFNQALDRQRAAPTQLDVKLASSLQDLVLIARSQPDAALSINVAGRDIPIPRNAEGVFGLTGGDLTERLPEGRYDVTVTALRSGSQTTVRRALLIDRTPPVFSRLRLSRSGRAAQLSGRVSDVSASVNLRAEVAGRVYTRTLRLPQEADFEWLLPLPTPDALITLQASDEAGNVAAAPLTTDVNHAAP